METTNTSVTYTCGGCGETGTADKAPADPAPQIPEWSDVSVAQRGRTHRSSTLCPRCTNAVLVIVTGGRR